MTDKQRLEFLRSYGFKVELTDKPTSKEGQSSGSPVATHRKANRVLCSSAKSAAKRYRIKPIG